MKIDDSNTCSFCGRGPNDAPKLIAGERGTICSNCVAFLYDVLKAEGMDMTLHRKGGSFPRQESGATNPDNPSGENC